MFEKKVVLNTLSVYKCYTYIICEVFILAAITLSVPNDLKEKMDKTDWVNWSSVARKAFASTLVDLERLERMKKIEEISEISPNDNREVRTDIVREIVDKTEKVSKEIAQGKRKTLSPSEFKKMCNNL